jgi:hypothetical protein
MIYTFDEIHRRSKLKLQLFIQGTVLTGKGRCHPLPNEIGDILDYEM